MKGDTHGFTLVELLVVVAIIVVLLAMLSPALDKAMDRAMIVRCQGNTRAIAMSSLAYAHAHRGAVPVFEMWNEHFARYNFAPVGTFEARPFLQELTGTREAYYCPADRLGPRTPGVGWDNKNSDFIQISYSLVGLWRPTPVQVARWPGWKTMYTDLPKPSGGTNRPARLAQADNASRIALATDSQRSYQATGFSYPGHRDWSHANDNYVYPHRREDMSWDGTSSAFFDGHSEYRRFEEFFDADADYPHGARWFMWRDRGYMNFETPIWW